MRTINALGFIEVYGMVAGIEAADAMLKSAQVRILRQHGVNPGQITLVIEGDLAACRAAVNAGVAAASRVGTVISNHVIGRPDTDTETMILDMLQETADQPKEPETRRDIVPEAPVPVPGKLGEVLAYIANATSGCSWKELKTHFPGLSQHIRKQLDAAVASGEVVKAGARYRAPDRKE